MYTSVHQNTPQFDRVKGRVRDPSSNPMLLLTSSIIVPSFIILRLRVLKLSCERTDRRTDGHTRQSHKVFWWTLIITDFVNYYLKNVILHINRSVLKITSFILQVFFSWDWEYIVMLRKSECSKVERYT